MRRRGVGKGMGVVEILLWGCFDFLGVVGGSFSSMNVATRYRNNRVLSRCDVILGEFRQSDLAAGGRHTRHMGLSFEITLHYKNLHIPTRPSASGRD